MPKPEFIHLHTHTHYSLLSSPILGKELFEECHKKGMTAVGVTDHASLFNMPQLFAESKNDSIGIDIKLIVGSELYMAPGSRLQKESRDAYHLNVLVKDHTGYRNLCKILSAASRDGFYFRPRADLDLLSRYHEGLICMTSCEKGELPRLITKGDITGAETFIDTYKSLFGEDFYIELEYHLTDAEAALNRELIRLATKHNVRLVATNDVHYLHREDSEKQEILMCTKGKHKLSDTKRMRFPTNEFYFKSAEEMALLFDNHHRELSHTLEIAEKCTYRFKKVEMAELPHFPIPQEFTNDKAYLRHLTFEGARLRYGDLEAQGEKGKLIRERIEYELSTIDRMNYDSYFLIVSDLINASRKAGYSVGPGRGSAAGSIVAYLTGITQVDPIQYRLLFERFLNPERVSMPDIDIDFTPVGKQKVLDYTIEKYGEASVSKIVAITTLGAKAVLKDVGRALDIPLDKVSSITNLVPSKPAKASLSDFIHGKFKKDGTAEIEPVKALKDLLQGQDSQIRRMLRYGLELEGRARNASVHAAGVVITNGPVDDYVPLYVSDKIASEERRSLDDDSDSERGDSEGKAKDEKQVITQFDKDWIEKAGLLKIDYLGLETLAVIDETLHLIEKRYGKSIDLLSLPMDDAATFKIFQDGKMAGIFQFESPGMQSYMMQLKPTSVEDIIAMSALYRPGPMQFIPDYIECKHGKKKVTYPHPLLEPILNYTYGIMVYQEQIMQTAQILAGYSLGGADLLRRAMGKKDKDTMMKERATFIVGAKATHGIDEEEAGGIFAVMERFAEYGFNRSHSAAYGILAYQTAYLKAHFPNEFVTAILNSEAQDKKRVKHLTDEAKSMGIKFLPPSINKSDVIFTVEDLPDSTKKIRVGFNAIKSVGNAAKEIVLARRRLKDGYHHFFDFCASVNLKDVRKNVFESLIYAGTFDEFGIGRATLLHNLDKAIDYGQRMSKRQAMGQEDFFDSADAGTPTYPVPTLDEVAEMPDHERLNREKELVGFYLSRHPLDAYKMDYDAFCTLRLNDTEFHAKQTYRVIGFITETKKHLDKKGNTMLFGTIEDYYGKADFTVFSKVYERFERDLQKDHPVILVAEADHGEKAVKLLVSEVIPLKKARATFPHRLILSLNADDHDFERKAHEVYRVCHHHQGETELDILLSLKHNGTQHEFSLYARKARIDSAPEVVNAISAILGEDHVHLKLSS